MRAECGLSPQRKTAITTNRKPSTPEPDRGLKDSIEGFILTGGQSRRMGTDKANLQLEGRSFQVRIALELFPVVDSVTIVGGAELERTLDGFPVRYASDVYTNWGALGGVHAALAACTSNWALVVACDYPFVTADLFTRLITLRQDAEAVAPIQRDSIPQPLCSLYKVSPCLEIAEELIKSAERKPIALLQSVRTRWVQFEEVGDLDGAQRFFENINSPEDYDRITKDRIDV